MTGARLDITKKNGGTLVHRKILAGIVLGMTAATSHAAVVHYQFTATITNSENLPSIHVGDTVSGEFSYDTSVPREGLHNLGSFDGAVLTMSVAGFSTTSSTSSRVFVNTYSAPDYFQGYSFAKGTGGTGQIVINLLDSLNDGLVTDNTVLPTSLPDLARFDPFNRAFSYVLVPLLGPSQSLNGNLLTLTQVPIPAAAWLLGSAIGLLGVLRRWGPA